MTTLQAVPNLSSSKIPTGSKMGYTQDFCAVSISDEDRSKYAFLKDEPFFVINDLFLKYDDKILRVLHIKDLEDKEYLVHIKSPVFSHRLNFKYQDKVYSLHWNDAGINL